MPKAIVNGINMYYEVHGQGEPLVLIHGFGVGHRSWFFQVHALQKYFQVITFDSRGIGRTGGLKEPFTIMTMASDVIGLMDHLGIDRANIMGVSLGGMVAQEIAIAYPHRVRKLILVNTFTTTERNHRFSDLLKAYIIKDGSVAVDIKNADINKLANSIVSLATNKRVYRILAITFFKVHRLVVSDRGYLKQVEAVRGYDTVDKLELIQTPTLIINGSGDRLIPPRNSELIASRIPNSKLVKVDGGSHALFIEMRDRFNRGILDFLISKPTSN